jgi:CPA2 family monovalent cation:H+ antiporter-2
MNGHLAHVLAELAVIVGAAAVVSLLFAALRLPLVLGYILAGLLIGPHVLPSLVPDTALVSTLSDLGVILLFFTIGLEFSVRTIARVGFATLVTVLIELSLVITLVYAVGTAFGWTATEALFAAVGVAIASTMLVVKGLEEAKLSGPAVELILAMMVVEDLISILLLAVLAAVASGSGLDTGELARLVGQMALFLIAILVGGLLVVPRTIRAVERRKRSETLLVTSLAICFAMVWAAQRAGYSIALGAFVAGMLIAESGKGRQVDALVRPFRDTFAAVFFVSIGMMIDPALVADNWLAAIVIAVVLVVGKTIAVTTAAVATGQGLTNAVRAGLSLSQIGEYAFIVASVGIAAGVAQPFLLPVVVGAGCITAITGTWQVRRSDAAASWLARHLPRPLTTFVSFYEAWLARLRGANREATAWRGIRRAAIALVADTLLLGAVVIGGTIARPRLARWLADTLDLAPGVARVAITVLAFAIGGVFAIGCVRQAIALAHRLAAEMIPPAKRTTDASPRRALVLVLEIAIALVVGLPLAAVTQPFVSGGGLIVLAVVVTLVLLARRKILDFDSHVHAGSQLIVEVLARQSREPGESATDLTQAQALLPGFEGLVSIELPGGAPAVGRSLGEIDLRAKTGASVLAIRRGGVGLPSPSPTEPLRVGDVLAVAGSDEAIAAARAVLVGTPPGEHDFVTEALG